MYSVTASVTLQPGWGHSWVVVVVVFSNEDILLSF